VINDLQESSGSDEDEDQEVSHAQVDQEEVGGSAHVPGATNHESNHRVPHRPNQEDRDDEDADRDADVERKVIRERFNDPRIIVEDVQAQVGVNVDLIVVYAVTVKVKTGLVGIHPGPLNLKFP